MLEEDRDGEESVKEEVLVFRWDKKSTHTRECEGGGAPVAEVSDR